MNIEALRLRRASLQQSNVPTVRMKRGDFSELPGAIYTPGPADSRTPFPGNLIPAPLQNPVAQRVLAFYPEPNRPGLVNNYVAFSPTDTNERQINARLDYRVTPAQQFFIRYTGNDDTTADSGNFPRSLATSSQQGRLRSEPRNVVLDYVNTLSSTLLLHANAGWSRYTFDRDHASRGFHPGSLGFPSSITNTSGAGGIFPGFAPTGYAALGPPERMGVRNENHDLFSFSGDVSLTRGSRTLKLGGNFRMNRLYFYAAQNPAGYFTFTRSFTARTPTDVRSGDPMASFLLGVPFSGYLGLAPRLALQSNYFALYAQHDWTVTRNLMVNLGLRRGGRKQHRRFWRN